VPRRASVARPIRRSAVRGRLPRRLRAVSPDPPDAVAAAAAGL